MDNHKITIDKKGKVHSNLAWKIDGKSIVTETRATVDPSLKPVPKTGDNFQQPIGSKCFNGFYTNVNIPSPFLTSPYYFGLPTILAINR